MKERETYGNYHITCKNTMNNVINPQLFFLRGRNWEKIYFWPFFNGILDIKRPHIS